MSLPRYTAASSPSSPLTPLSHDVPPPAPQPGIEQPQATAAEQQSQGVVNRHYDEEKSYDAPQLQQSQFYPFFTLIEDAQSSEYFHPTVHYIFSDDDTDIVTEAVLRSLEIDHENVTASNGTTQAQDQHIYLKDEAKEGAKDSGLSSLRKEALLPPPTPGVRDNYIIVDIEPEYFDRPPTDLESGPGPRSLSTSPTSQQLHIRQQRQFTVVSAQSLTSSWQILETQVTAAPTFENTASDEQPTNGGLMLKIHGTTGAPTTVPRKRDRDKDSGSQRLEEMMNQFAKGMGELRRVIEAAEQVPRSRDPAYMGENPSSGEKSREQCDETAEGRGRAEVEG